MRISNEEKHRVIYTNSWVTDKEIREENIEHLASCARTRWKIENEHNNVLKNRGYNLEHNFGHGKNHASELFFLLNLLAFQFHTILGWCDEDYQKPGPWLAGGTPFFTICRRHYANALYRFRHDFLVFVRGGDDEGVPDG